MSLPDMMRQNETPNEQNYIVFGVVNRFRYTNHRGEMAYRAFIPLCIRFGQTEHHKEDTWLLETFDVEKNAYRTYVLDRVLPR